jgi:D-aminopeptidase
MPRAREAGIVVGPDPTGEHNAITDVPGVRVGQVTLVRGDGPLRIGEGPVRTGVTAIVPSGDDWFHAPLEAGHFVFNGAGTTAGLSLIDEFGRIETPVLLTNTLSVGTVYEGVVRYMVQRIFAPRGHVPWFNPVVGETSDTYLNDMGGLHVRPEHAVEAIERAAGGPVAEGCVGAGTGTSAFGFKGGIGTSSRVVNIAGEPATIGVLVQSNFGGRLTIAGVPMDTLQDELALAAAAAATGTPPTAAAGGAGEQPPTATRPVGEREAPGAARAGDGASIMVVVATDLPLSSRLLGRLAKRATFGLARAGSSGGHGSGDYVIAFSTSYRQGRHSAAKPAIREALARDESAIDAAFRAVADATEEAILNSLFRAERMVGRDGHVREALPIGRALARLRQAGVLRQPHG